MSESLSVAGIPFTLDWDGAPGGGVGADGTLEVSAGAHSDMVIDPGGPGHHMNVPRLIGNPPAGDFQLSAKVSVDLVSTFDAGALIIFVDERHWGKLLLERSVGGENTVVTVITRGVSDDCDSFRTAESHIWLRVSRLGEAFAFHASLDGESWRFVRYFSLAHDHGPLEGALRIGFEAQSPTGEGCAARFSEISFVPERLVDMRNGV